MELTVDMTPNVPNSKFGILDKNRIYLLQTTSYELAGNDLFVTDVFDKQHDIYQILKSTVHVDFDSSSLQSRYRASLTTTSTTLNSASFLSSSFSVLHPLCFLIENEGDVLWTPDTREKNEDVAARGVKFMKWLLTREEKEIAVVTHSGFLFHTLAAYGDDCHPTLKKEMSKHFNNCELRSMVIIDRSMLGSNASKTDFPGKIPSGTDVPSDVV
ncbi:LOW QUALITY PROTEIN: phosphoglycerate mutase-like protein 1 [Lactuca sativa]|uniref:LOW QUALITY PROTEIN: phosphoglycerate mutase-like protein 1 n=1 Tax=Lactuca sativa TaxID=4236 RepID=UPI0022B060BD|nr:LOW QUALITY PROTEIN: phosphoglycerate mutase-like protein 1 [Lactuca sativa]